MLASIFQRGRLIHVEVHRCITGAMITFGLQLSHHESFPNTTSEQRSGLSNLLWFSGVDHVSVITLAINQHRVLVKS